MIEILDVVAIIGMLTGVISLIWHIKDNRCRLILENAYFKKDGFDVTVPRTGKIIGVKINLRNKGNKPTTVENLMICIGNKCQIPKLFKRVTIPANNSKSLEYILDFSEDQFDKLFSGDKVEFIVSITHTFGDIRKKEKTDFKTGYFSVR